jgi:hypothetical protein
MMGLGLALEIAICMTCSTWPSAYPKVARCTPQYQSSKQTMTSRGIIGYVSELVHGTTKDVPFALYLQKDLFHRQLPSCRHLNS